MPQVALRTAGPRRDDRFHHGKALPLPLPRGPRVSKQGSAQNRGTCLPPPVRYRTSFHVHFQRLMSHTSAALTAKAQQAVSTMRASTGSEPIVPIKS